MLMSVCTRLVCIVVTVATQRVATSVVVFQNGVELTVRQVMSHEGAFLFMNDFFKCANTTNIYIRFATKIYQQIEIIGIHMGINCNLLLQGYCFVTKETLCCPFLIKIRPILLNYLIQRLDSWMTY